MNDTTTARSYEGEALEQLLLMLADNIIKMQNLERPDTIQMFGAATLAGGRLLIRGVPEAMVTDAVSAVAQLPEDIAGQFVRSLSLMIRTMRVQDSNGQIVMVAIRERTDYSFERDEMDQTILITHCMEAFYVQDYSECVARAWEALKTYSHSMLYQLLVISLQRLNRGNEAEVQGHRALAALTYAQWHQLLMGITLGIVDVEKVYAEANNERERCQVRFYEGARLLTLGKVFDAKLSLTECLRCSTDIMEKPMAQFELDSIK
jgi:hypothetical protein